MKNNRLVDRLKVTASKNLGKAFFALFVMVILETVNSFIFAAPALVLMESEENAILNTVAYAFMIAGIFVWFLLQSGFAVMLLRMVRNQYVSIGYLLFGIRKFRQFGPVAAAYTVITVAITFAVRFGCGLILDMNADIFAFISEKAGNNGSIIVIALVLLLLVALVLYNFLYLVQLRYDNPEKNIFWTMKTSLRLIWKNGFKQFLFIIRASGRNFVLALFYFGLTFYVAGSEGQNALMGLFSLIVNFLYFINIYKALVLVYMAVPVFYDDLMQPKIQIIISQDE